MNITLLNYIDKLEQKTSLKIYFRLFRASS